MLGSSHSVQNPPVWAQYNDYNKQKRKDIALNGSRCNIYSQEISKKPLC